MMIISIKALLTLFALVIAAAAVVFFFGILVREIALELRAKFSAESWLDPPPIRPEYSLKESPAWARNLSNERGHALACKLASMGE